MLRLKAVVLGFTGALMFAAGAQAADTALRPAPLDYVLRGSTYAGEPAAAPPRFLPEWPVYRRWQGFYLGGTLGIGSSGMDFSNGTASLIAYILRNDVVGNHVVDWTTLGKVDPTQQTFGGFVGYNAQFDGNIVVGGEFNYSHAIGNGFFGSSADAMTRQFNDDAVAPAGHHYFYTATVASSASARLTDYATARARAGWVVDRFMPYAFVGAAVGQVDVVRSATVSYVRHDVPDNVAPPAPPITPDPDFFFGPQTNSAQKKGAFAYGYAVGLGVDVAVLPNVFVRAEYEFVQFAAVENVKLYVQSGRIGAGVKF
jgi:opacity protein-like surface antigen